MMLQSVCVISKADLKQAYHMPKVAKQMISEDTLNDIDLMAHIIHHECGANWCSDEMRYFTGYVVMNRVNSDLFPNTIYDVIYQPGQYSGASNLIYETYSDHIYEIATEIVLGGSQIPENVLFQANFVQGDGVYAQVQNMYFCYKGEL